MRPMGSTSLYQKMLEHLRLQLIIRPIAQEFGIDPKELIDEARQFFALTDAEQDREFERMIALAEVEGSEEDVRVMREGWAAIKEYR